MKTKLTLTQKRQREASKMCLESARQAFIGLDGKPLTRPLPFGKMAVKENR